MINIKTSNLNESEYKNIKAINTPARINAITINVIGIISVLIVSLTGLGIK
ncbi:MAG: hypothetical protein U9R06_01900 [Patescibacteria group bacterium]|nr:hypothetical protein [Patescibacteria group bacterium]